nr:putative reverse transcriptase, RNA-dependent DNA polymerase [Tanacetum cinerariifolium]
MDSPGAGLKPSGEEEKKDAEDPWNKDSEVPSTEKPRVNQKKDANVNNTNNTNTVSPTDNAAGIEDNVIDENIGADINNLDTYFQVSSVPTTRIHKDHPLNQVIRDLQSTTQTRQMIKNLEEYGLAKLKKVVQVLKDPSLIEAMQEELLQFKLQEVWTLVELPNGKRAIGTKWVFRNKKDKRGIVIKNKARLVAQGYTQEDEINYDKMVVKSAFLYDKIEEEVYVCQPPSFEDLDFPDRKEDGIFISQDKYVNEILNKFGFSNVKTSSTPMETHKTLLKDEKGEDVDEHVYRSMIGSLMYLTSSRPDIIYLKGQPKLGLWYPKDSPFDLVTYTNSDYAGASLDRKSTIGGCQFLGCRLISWLCKKQIVVANSTTEAEYVTKIHIDNESTICIVKNPVFHSKTKHIEIRHHLIRDSNEKKLIQMIKIHTDKNVADLLTKVFDATTKVKNINGEAQLHAKVDGKKVVIFKASIRRELQFGDEGGIDCLPNETIFEQLTLMGAKTTAWNKFSSTIASAVICLATNQKFNFYKYIIDSMVKNLDSATKILMFPRFVQVFLNNQLEEMANHTRIYVPPSHTKKIFRNMKRVGKGFSRRDTPLFPTMMVQDQEELGKDVPILTKTHPTPIITQPSSSQPSRKQKPRKIRRQDIELPQTSVPTKTVVDEAVNEEMYDSLERATTTATGLDAEQDRGNISKTQSKATPNEPSSSRTSSGGDPKRQDIIRDTIAQTRSENVSNFSNDPPLSRVNTLRNREDRMKLKELMDLYTKLSDRVLNLETIKTAQEKEKIITG